MRTGHLDSRLQKLGAFPLRGRTLVAAAALLVIQAGLHAQTVTDFVNTSGWSAMRVGAATFADLYDNGAAGLDTTKITGLSGSNKIWDMVGDSTRPVFQIASGTTPSGPAYAWSVRLADFDVNGLKTGTVGMLLADSTHGYYGYAMSFAANGNVSLYRIKPAAPFNFNPGAFTFTYGNNATATGSAAVTAGGILRNYEQITSGTPLSATSDAWLTFVIPLSEIAAFTGDNNWTYVNTIGATAFTSSGTINGKITADYAGTTTSLLTFSSQSGTVVVPEPETYAGFATASLALFWVGRRRLQAPKAA